MNIMKENKMEAALQDGEPAGAPAPVREARGIPEQPVDESEAAAFSEIDDDLFGRADDEDSTSIDEVNEGPELAEPEPMVEVAPQPTPAMPEAIAAPSVQPQPAASSPPAALPSAPAPLPTPTAPSGPSYDELREAARKELEVRYSLSKEDADAMISEPETVVPRLMSQIYLDVYDNVLRSMQVYLPQMVQQVNSYSEVQQRDENDFYSAWPKLREHGESVAQIGRTYRQLNPMATKEQFIQEVGLHASIALKVPVESPLLQQQAATQSPPAASSNPPYVPPRGAPIAPPAQKPKPKGMFGELADEWEEMEKY